MFRKIKSRYKTTDGTIFNDLLEAENHQDNLDDNLMDEIRSDISDILPSSKDLDVESLTQYIINLLDELI